MKYAHRAGLNGHMSFIKFQENVYPYIAAMDILVIPSREETLSLVAAEANYLGKPVVACPAGGVPEVINLGGGVLTKGFDPTELAVEISRLVHDGELRSELGIRGHQQVTKHMDSGVNLAQIREVIMNVAHAGPQDR
jgi:hypothetical protein